MIFSRPIRSGKTTELKAAIPYMGKVNGILCPDRDDVRYLYDISAQKTYPLETTEPLETTSFELGRFHFLYTGFEKARKILLDTLYEQADWTIVDEVGKLEMQRNAGLEPALSQLIGHFKDGRQSGNLLLVVRDFLLERAIEHYALQEAIVTADMSAWKKD